MQEHLADIEFGLQNIFKVLVPSNWKGDNFLEFALETILGFT